MTVFRFAFFACAGLATSLPLAFADSITLTTLRDTTLYQSDHSRSNGAGGVFFTGNNSAGSPRRSLLWFDVSSIPAGSTIDSVQLTLHVASFGGSGGAGGSDPTAHQTSLHAVTREWGEGTAGAGTGATGSGQGFVTANDGTSATWSHAFYTNETWSSPGGDFNAAASATAAVTGTIDAAFTWGSTSALVADVQGWLDDSASNFGWILIGNESANQTFRSFYSREAEIASLRPELRINYTVVPEPSAWVLLTLGAGAAMFHCRGLRRRKA